MQKIHSNLVKELKRFVESTGYTKVVLGLSGGIDSAVCLKLCVDSLEESNVTALLMPESGLSTDKNLEDARQLCSSLGVQYDELDIKKLVKAFDSLPWIQNDLAQMNNRSRIRALVLYNYANSNRRLVIGTSNRSEMLIGYFTKYGDGAADVELIGDLYKTQVYELAKHLKLPNTFMKKKPSAELVQGQTDEDELGMDYEKLDKILGLLYDKKLADEKIMKKGIDKETLKKVKDRIKANAHKSRMPKILNAR